MNYSRRITDEMRILALSRLTRDDIILALIGPVMGMVVVVIFVFAGMISPEWGLVTILSILALSMLFAAGYAYRCLLSGLPYPNGYKRQLNRISLMVQSEPELLEVAPASSALAAVLTPGGMLNEDHIARYRERLDNSRWNRKLSSPDNG